MLLGIYSHIVTPSTEYKYISKAFFALPHNVSAVKLVRANSNTDQNY
jgi:hypothetical protein